VSTSIMPNCTANTLEVSPSGAITKIINPTSQITGTPVCGRSGHFRSTEPFREDTLSELQCSSAYARRE
jgi:hypothetical protein